MEGSEDFSTDDIWSPSLREELFADYNLGPSSWDSNANDLFFPRPLFNSATLERPTPSQQQWRVNNAPSHSSVSSLQRNATQLRKPSHLDLPNFPLPTDPTGTSSNSSGRPPPPSPNYVTQHRPVTTPTVREPFNPPPPPSLLDSDSSNLDSSFTDSDRSDTPWADSEEDNLDDFVDLIQDPSPPIMPSVRRPPSRRTPSQSLPQRKNALRGSVPAHLSEASPNPAKRRKIGTGASQSSRRSQEIEGIDLTGMDDDKGLSKVLEQQRIATIKAQQEQASKSVKLSTLQCIICMESMKDLTATSCGHLFCHSCLMEALIAGENQGGEPGKGVPKCPVCRKKVVRPLPTDKRDRHDVVPLAMKLKAKSKASKGKERAAE